ncbi:MAG: hypothetical protein U0704_07915 [Candidatus Eisenbacteria bacterium]
MTPRAALALTLLAALAAAALACAAPASAPAGGPAQAASPAAAPVRQPRLEDYIQPPGSSQPMQPFMLHADLWIGMDQRSVLDTVVYALENGARCCKVLNADSLWAVDYTWIYPHAVFPPRWYDARGLLAAADSLQVPDDAVLDFTFGTCRVGVRAKTYEQARAEAMRQWPAVMPERLAGRLRLKLDRANQALGRKPAE